MTAAAMEHYERALLAAERTAAESQARSRVVHEVVSELAAAVSVPDVAGVLLAHGRAALRAAGGAVWLVDAEAADRPPAGALPLQLAAAAELPERLRVALEAAGAWGPRLLRTGAVRVVPRNAALERVEPALAAAMAAERVAALVLVPVTAEGRRRGALVLLLDGSGGGRAGVGGDDELAVAERARFSGLADADADLLRTVGGQAGQALERVWLHEETARQAARSAFLLDAARLMAAAGGVRESVERLAEYAVPRLADLCVIDLRTDHGWVRPAARHADPARQDLVDRLREVHLPASGAAHPTVQAADAGRTVWVREVTDPWVVRISQDADHLAVVRGLELAGLVAVPLMTGGRLLGVLTLGAGRRRGSFTAADVEVAEQLALQVSQVVDKAQRLERETRTSHTLQANLLPPAPPPVPGLEVAVRYLAASRGAEVGGDFYDVVPLPGGGGVALAVGDVVGHDITAAAVMGQLRSVHRVLLADRPSPSAVIDRIQAGWALLGLQRMATALFGSLDPATGRLRLASAGHVCPLVVTPSDAAYLHIEPSRMLGAPVSGTPPREWTGVLPVGATLLLFTDGLVESRTADIDEGLSMLLDTAWEARGGSPDELCDRLLAELSGDHRTDDVALLAISRV